MTAHTVRQLRVFVSSPGDVAEERGRVPAILERLNGLSHIRDRIVLRPLAYERVGAVPPVVGREPQAIVDDYMGSAADADVFVCILWSRMGSPVVHPDTGERFLSGTEYEFITAYRANQNGRVPHILLYRCERPVPAGADQARLVDAFFHRVGATDSGREFIGLFSRYQDTHEFAERLFHDIESLIGREYLPAVDAEAAGPVVNIPVYDSEFVGRDRESATLREMLVEREHGLVVLRGTGGIGKTRLACEVARSIGDRFPGGAYYVELRDRLQPERVAYAVAFALGQADSMRGDEAPVELIGKLLDHRPKTLFVLNNLEPVENLAAQTIGYWRRVAPNCRLLVTCRESVPVEGAVDIRLGGLALPDDGDRTRGWERRLGESAAVRLFIATAKRGRRDFDMDVVTAPAVEQLCRTLQGQPLPVILVARLVRDASPAELAEEIQERKHELAADGLSVRDTIAWSYERLGAQHQEAFRQVSIFRDGFTLTAAKRVVQLSTVKALPAVVRHLCDVSLLESTHHGDETRYWMYQTVQDFARDVLGTPPPTELIDRWAAYFVEFAEQQARLMPTREAPVALDRMMRDRENLLAAHVFALECKDIPLAARIALGCAQFLESRAPWQVRRDRLTLTHSAVGDSDPVVRVRLLIELSDVFWYGGDFKRSHDFASQAVELVPNIDDPALRAEALLAKANAVHNIDNRDDARTAYLEALALAEQVGDVITQSYCLGGLGYIHDRWGQSEKACEYAERGVQLLRERDNVIDLARLVNVQGLILWHAEMMEPALVCFKEAEDLERRLGNNRMVAGRVTNQALALTDLDRLEEAIRRFETGDAMHTENENSTWRAVNSAGWGLALLLSGDLPQAESVLAAALPDAEASGYRENIAFVAGNLARVQLALARPDKAKPLFERAIEIQRKIDHGGNRRFWGNLVRLTEVERLLGNCDRARELHCEATALAAQLGITLEAPARLTREDELLRQRLTESLEGCHE